VEAGIPVTPSAQSGIPSCRVIFPTQIHGATWIGPFSYPENSTRLSTVHKGQPSYYVGSGMEQKILTLTDHLCQNFEWSQRTIDLTPLVKVRGSLESECLCERIDWLVGAQEALNMTRSWTASWGRKVWHRVTKVRPWIMNVKGISLIWHYMIPRIKDSNLNLDA
jgi:hypothetical protein